MVLPLEDLAGYNCLLSREHFVCLNHTRTLSSTVARMWLDIAQRQMEKHM